MTTQRIARFRALALVATLIVLTPGASYAIQLYQGGSTSQLVIDDTNFFGCTDLEVDPAGNLLVSRGTGGIVKVTTGGVETPFSSVTCFDLVLGPLGDGYASGGSSCDCISHVAADGTASPFLQDSHGWGSLALLPNGSLYALSDQGLNVVDRSTGTPTLLHAGGPANNGDGIYAGMLAGQDGKLYIEGSLDGSPAGWRVFTLDGTNLVPVSNSIGGRPALGPDGRFLTIAGHPGALYEISDLWLVDPVTGQADLIATSTPYFHHNDVTFNAVAFDAKTQTVYVVENEFLWALHLDLSTPAQAATWGAVKARYHS